MRHIDRSERLIDPPRRRSRSERLEAQRDYTRQYRSRNAAVGIPDRREAAEAALQVLLLSAYHSKSKDSPESRLLRQAAARLAAVRDERGLPAYTKQGIIRRLDSVLSELVRQQAGDPGVTKKDA